MRRVFAALMLGVPMMGVIYGLSVCQAQPVEVRHRLALMANDLPGFLDYQPTDGATRAGQIRRDMHLGQVDPH
jgi:hypothetical protein